jgi:hypothetical protein
MKELGNLMAHDVIGRSVAIWAQPKDAINHVSEAYLNVHFNYWHVRSQRSKKKSDDFFDIGIMVYSCANLSSIKVYLPTKIEKGSIEDLGHLFSQTVVASGVFNESLSATVEADSSHITLKNGTSTYARVYCFSKNLDKTTSENELLVSSHGNGTLIEFCPLAIENGCDGLPGDDPLYFRIRIRMPSGKNAPFSRMIKPVDGWLLSSFDYTEFLDFRLNEARNLPTPITKMMRVAVPILRVDCLIVVGEAADVAGGVESNKKRLLESELWDTYTHSPNREKLSDGMVIHHWKKVGSIDSPIDDFSAFIKLKIRRSGLSLISRYLIVVALIGCLGSLIASIVWSRFELESWVKPATRSDNKIVTVELPKIQESCILSKKCDGGEEIEKNKNSKVKPAAHTVLRGENGNK